MPSFASHCLAGSLCSYPAIQDLKQCLEYTGQHSKLVDSFISSLRYRLLTAGASTHDILHQYVSTIKALRIIDPTGVFLEAVGEPIRDYLRGRKDTIKCIVTMLTDGPGGNPSGPGNAGDSLLEELNRDAENRESTEYDDDINSDDKQAWINAERHVFLMMFRAQICLLFISSLLSIVIWHCYKLTYYQSACFTIIAVLLFSWEPDPVEADPSKGSRNRRKIDVLGMMVNIIGSKDQLVNEYRVMLAEKLLNKSDYDIDSEIRTLELLKVGFMHINIVVVHLDVLTESLQLHFCFCQLIMLSCTLTFDILCNQIHLGESSIQKCEIMLNDMIDSKRTNANIKASLPQPSLSGILNSFEK